jgi:hypothetical protein
MFYAVKLSPADVNALRALVGRPLDLVAADGWAAELHSGDTILLVKPEEFATPDAEHPRGDVERPLIELRSESALAGGLDRLAEHIGLVRAVKVISVLLTFSPMVDCTGEEIRPGVALPEGSQAYGWLFYHPSQRDLAEKEVGPARALVDLDIGFELVTDQCPSLVLYTECYFIKVSQRGLPQDADWARLGTFVRRSL